MSNISTLRFICYVVILYYNNNGQKDCLHLIDRWLFLALLVLENSAVSHSRANLRFTLQSEDGEATVRIASNVGGFLSFAR